LGLSAFCEIFELVDKWAGDSVERSHLVRRQTHILIIHNLNNRMVLLQVNPIRRFNNKDSFIVLLVFIYDVLDWRIMFLMSHVDVAQQWTLPR